jgi:hypothetical protein
MFEGICEALHREMEMLEDKYSNNKSPMNAQDLEHIDKMAHALKSLKTYEAMNGNSEYGSYDGGSYARGRSRTTGRYISRDGYPEGYERRY